MINTIQETNTKDSEENTVVKAIQFHQQLGEANQMKSLFLS